jgi:hypothetical protein
MKLQRTTLVLVVSALLLGGFVYFYEIQGAPNGKRLRQQSSLSLGLKMTKFKP